MDDDTCLIGYRFSPTDQELIGYYLKNKILGLQTMQWESTKIIEGDIYGENATPWDLFRFEDKNLPWEIEVDKMNKFQPLERVLYVFTRLSNVGKTEKSGNKQKNRVAGCGTWHGNTKPQPVFDRAERVIGYKRTFTFRSHQETVGQWTMYEYTVDAAAYGITGNNGFNCDDYVLCKIKRDDSKRSKGGKLISWKRDITSLLMHDQGESSVKKIKLNDDNQSALSAAPPLMAAEVDHQLHCGGISCQDLEGTTSTAITMVEEQKTDDRMGSIAGGCVVPQLLGPHQSETFMNDFANNWEGDILDDNLCFDPYTILNDFANFP